MTTSSDYLADDPVLDELAEPTDRPPRSRQPCRVTDPEPLEALTSAQGHPVPSYAVFRRRTLTQYFTELLDLTSGNITNAARAADLPRVTFRRHLKNLGLYRATTPAEAHARSRERRSAAQGQLLGVLTNKPQTTRALTEQVGVSMAWAKHELKRLLRAAKIRGWRSTGRGGPWVWEALDLLGGEPTDRPDEIQERPSR